MADDDLKAELERLKLENERLKTRQTRGVSLKVSKKGSERPRRFEPAGPASLA